MTSNKNICYFTILLLLIVGIILLLTVGVNIDKKNQSKKYKLTDIITYDINYNSRDCSVIRNCICRETDSNNTCNSNIMIGGKCSNGYKCCKTKCRTCPSSTMVYPCDCKCVDAVFNEECTKYVGKCFSPIIHIKYPLNEMRELFNECYNENMDNDTMINVNCNKYLEFTFKEKECGYNDYNCLYEFSDLYKENILQKAYYNSEDYSDVVLYEYYNESYNYVMSTLMILMLMLFSLLLFIMLFNAILVCWCLPDIKRETEQEEQKI